VSIKGLTLAKHQTTIDDEQLSKWATAVTVDQFTLQGAPKSSSLTNFVIFFGEN